MKETKMKNQITVTYDPTDIDSVEFALAILGDNRYRLTHGNDTTTPFDGKLAADKYTPAPSDTIVPPPPPAPSDTIVPPPPPAPAPKAPDLSPLFAGTTSVDSRPPPPPLAPLDSAGYPYDPTVHTRTQALTKAGRFKWGRGVSPEAKAAFEDKHAGPVPADASAADMLAGMFAAQDAGAVTFADVLAVIKERASKYTEAQLGAALGSVGIEATGLQSPDRAHLWPVAIDTLKDRCPL